MIFYRICILIFGCFLLLNLSAQEQSKELCGITYSVSQIKNDSVNGRNQNFDAFVHFPLIKKDNFVMAGKVNFSQNKYQGIGDIFDLSLTTMDATLFLSKKINDNNKLQLIGKGGLYSDFKDIGWKDFRYRIGINVAHTFSEKLKVGMGIAYARQFKAHQINPFLSVNYKINKNFILSGLLPIKPTLTYIINENWKWSSGITSNVESFRLSSSANNQIVEFSGWKAASDVAYTFRKKHRFSLGLSYSFQQNIRLYNDIKENNWKIFTFNLSEKVAPFSEEKFTKLSCFIKYNFVL